MSSTDAKTHRFYRKTYLVKELLDDFEYLLTCLRDGHPSLYHFSTEADFKRMIYFTSSKLSDELSSYDFYLILFDFLNSIGNAYTDIWPDLKTMKDLFNNSGLLPLKPVIIENEVFLKYDYRLDSIEEGSQILSIDGIAIENLIKLALAQITTDGHNEQHKLRTLEERFNGLIPLILGLKDQYLIEYREYGTDIIKTNLMQTTTMRQLRKTREQWFTHETYSPLYELNYDYSVNTAILKIQYFMDGKQMAKETGISLYKQDGKLDKFLHKAFKNIRRNNIKHLIVDLRDNNRGQSELAKELYSYIAPDNFTYYKGLKVRRSLDNILRKLHLHSKKLGLKFHKKIADDSEMSVLDNKLFHKSYYRPSKPKDHNFEGEVFVLTNGNTYDPATEFIRFGKHKDRLILIGESPKGLYGPSTKENYIVLTLPHTKLRVRMPILQTVLEGDENQKPGAIKPDFKVPDILDNIITGEDTQLNYVLDLIYQQYENVERNGMFTLSSSGTITGS